MNCKYCNELLEDGVTVCPGCGRDSSQEPAQQVISEEICFEEEPVKKGRNKRILALIGCAILVVGLAVTAFFTGSQTGENIHAKTSYTAEDSKVIAAGDTVIAEFAGQKLTNKQLQVIYWWGVYDFLEYNGSYLSSLKLDLSKPLESQQMLDTGNTWQQYFLSVALENWQRWQALCMMAKQAGVSLDPTIAEQLKTLPETMEQIALQNKYADANALLADELGAGADMQAYLDYLEFSEYAMQYYYDAFDELNPTDAEIEAHFSENQEQFTVNKQSGKYVDVRHILIRPEGCTLDAYNQVTATEDQWEACRVKCQQMLDDWKNGGASEDAFGEMAKAHSVDEGSATGGGLYTGVAKGDMVANFDAWCFDANRKAGDSGLVQTGFGYHLMYYVGDEDIWFVESRESLKQTLLDRRIAQAIAENASQIDYRKILLGAVSFT